MGCKLIYNTFSRVPFGTEFVKIGDVGEALEERRFKKSGLVSLLILRLRE